MRNGDPSGAPSFGVVRLVVALSLLSTAIHFTDNYVSIDTYPQADWITGMVVIVTWPLFSSLGVIAVFLYRGGRFGLANAFLLWYSTVGFSSLLHFYWGSPDELTTRGIVTVLSDGLAGLLVFVTAIWSIAAHTGVAGVFAPSFSRRIN